MPFTFAHPAIVLPLAKLPRRWFSLTGLVIGSIAPDFEYFFRMEPTSDHSHTIAGLFYFNLPVSLMLAFLFHKFIRDPLIDHLPEPLFARFYPYKGSEWFRYFKNNFFAVILSILIGAFSHIFLDSFTHQDALFVELLQLQNTTLFSFPIYRVFQHVSTLIGFAFIGWVIWRLEPHSIKRPSVSLYAFWLKIILVTFATFGLTFIVAYPLDLGETVVGIINGGMLGLFFASVTSKKENNNLSASFK